MPSLYGFTSNANVRVGNTTGLYQQPGGSVAVLSSAQVLLNNLSQNGNVNFALDPAYGNTKVLAYTSPIGTPAGTFGSSTAIPIITTTDDGRVQGISEVTISIPPANLYSNTNVAAYLPTYTGALNPSIVTAGNILTTSGVYWAGNGQPYSSGSGSSSIQLTGNVTGSGTTGSPINTTIAASGVTPGAYGSDTVIPHIVVGLDGRITQITTNAISGGGSYGNSNVAAYLPTYTGSLELSSSVVNLWANAAAQSNQIAGANAAIVTANTAMKAYVDAANTIQSNQINSINANLGGFEAYANVTYSTIANAASLQSQITGANAAIVTANTAMKAYVDAANTIQSNQIQTISANLGAFEAYANATFGTSNYANANVTALLSSNTVSTINTTGNITTVASVNANQLHTTDGVYSQGNITAPYFLGDGGALSNIVTKIVAGSNIAISPAGGQGQVTISQIGGQAAGTSTGYYGNFYDTTTQYANVATTAYPVSINSTTGNSGVTLSGNLMTFTYPGVYNVAFSVQFVNTDNAQHEANVWLTQNGTPLSYSNSQVTIPARANATTPGAILMTVPQVVTVGAGDTIGLQWQQDSGSSVVSIATIAAGTSPTRPSIPGIIVTATQVTSVTGNQYGDSNVATFLGSNFGSNTITTTGKITAGNVVSTSGYFWANGAAYAPSSTPSGAAGGDLTGTYPNPTLTTSGVSAGTYGSTTQVAQVTFDAKGRATSASNVTISGTTPGGSAGGDLTGTYPNPTLTTTGVVADTYGSATSVPQFTVDAKGRITAVSNVAISAASSGFSGNLAGNTLIDSVNGRIIANASPFNSVVTTQAGTQSSYVTYTPVYTSGNLIAPNASGLNQTVGQVVSGNINLLTQWGVGNRTTSMFSSYHAMTATSANTAINTSDRVRGSSSTLEVQMNGKNWGTLTSTMTGTLSTVAAGNQALLFGPGQIGQVIGVNGTVTVVPQNGSLNAQYATANYGSIVHTAGATGATASNIAYARLFSGGITGQSGNITVVNAIGLHTFSGWVSANTSLVNNAYSVLNEDTRSSITNFGPMNQYATFTSNAAVNLNGAVTSTAGLQATAIGNVTPGTGVFTTGTFNTATTGGLQAVAIGNVTPGTGAFTTLTATTADFTSANLSLGAYQEKQYSLGTTSGNLAINYSNGTVQKATLNGDIQLWSNNFTNFIAGRSITLILTQDGTGSRVINTTNLKYAGGVNTLSTAANSIDVMNIYYDGTNYLTALVKGYV